MQAKKDSNAFSDRVYSLVWVKWGYEGLKELVRDAQKAKSRFRRQRRICTPIMTRRSIGLVVLLGLIYDLNVILNVWNTVITRAMINCVIVRV